MNTIQVLQRLHKETKAEVYLVGGFVRDYLRNKHNKDIDVVVRNLSQRNIKKFLNRYGKLKEVELAQTNDTFQVRIMLFKASDSDLEAQITLPRRSKKQIPDSHNTLKQDVRFRDFRINCLYLPVDYKSKRDVVDIVGGREDIVNRRIVANGSAVERIKESPIRMMRAISLASRTNYTIDTDLIEAIIANAFMIKKCPVEAIRRELNTILMSRKPSKYIRLLRKTGLLKYVAPEVSDCIGVKQDNRYHKYDVFTHLLYTVDNCEFDITIRLAGLLHDIGKPVTRKETKGSKGRSKVTFHNHEVASSRLAKNFLGRLKYDTETIKQVLSLVKLHMYHFTREWGDSAVRKFIRKAQMTEEYLNEDNIQKFPLFKLRAAERLGNGLKGTAITDRQRDFEKKLIKVYRESSGLEIKDLDIDGNIIMATFKVPPGIHVGAVLKFLLEKVLEKPDLNNRLDLLKIATEYFFNKARKESGGS